MSNWWEGQHEIERTLLPNGVLVVTSNWDYGDLYETVVYPDGLGEPIESHVYATDKQAYAGHRRIVQQTLRVLNRH